MFPVHSRKCTFHSRSLSPFVSAMSTIHCRNALPCLGSKLGCGTLKNSRGAHNNWHRWLRTLPPVVTLCLLILPSLGNLPKLPPERGARAFSGMLRGLNATCERCRRKGKVYLQLHRLNRKNARQSLTPGWDEPRFEKARRNSRSFSFGSLYKSCWSRQSVGGTPRRDAGRLAAEYLQEGTGDRARLALRYFLAGDQWWKEVLGFYVTLAGNPADLEDWLVSRSQQLAKSADATTLRSGAWDERLNSLRTGLREAFPSYASKYPADGVVTETVNVSGGFAKNRRTLSGVRLD
jgi:hypothetical protein